MPPLNKIIEHNLESRVIELQKQEIPIRKIASILSDEIGQTITKSMVFTFLKSDVKVKTEIIEKKDELKLKVVEAEISTINYRKDVIFGLLNLASTAENEHARVQAYKAANEALDSLDKRLGKVSPETNTVINITQNNLTIKEKIQRYREMGILNGSQ
jgi:hypothetical protein